MSNPNTRFVYYTYTRLDYDEGADVLYAKAIGKECWTGAEITPFIIVSYDKVHDVTGAQILDAIRMPLEYWLESESRKTMPEALRLDLDKWFRGRPAYRT